MNIIFVLIPLSLLMSSIALAVFFWAINNGQFDDLETPVYRVLMEDKTPAPANHPVTPPSGDNVA